MICTTCFILSAGLFLALAPANGQDKKRTSIEEFGGTTQFQLLKCQLTAKLAFLKVESGELREAYSEIGACLKQGREEVKKLFPRAHAQVAKKAAASKHFKEYYAVWLTAFDGISPEVDERKIDYERRQGEASRKAHEAWNRFEIEAGL